MINRVDFLSIVLFNFDFETPIGFLIKLIVQLYKGYPHPRYKNSPSLPSLPEDPFLNLPFVRSTRTSYLVRCSTYLDFVCLVFGPSELLELYMFGSWSTLPTKTFHVKYHAPVHLTYISKHPVHNLNPLSYIKILVRSSSVICTNNLLIFYV